ncbi:MAG: response regulator transcription factor [Beijerinckiaceae bacterium]
MNELKILLVDDHPVVREGYRRLLERQNGYRVVAEADSARDAYLAYRQHAPDLVIMDVSLTGPSGIEAVRHIRQWDQQAKILMFTMHESAGCAMKAMEAGALGYVTKSSTPAELLLAVAKVSRGSIALGDDIARAIAEERVAGRHAQLDALGVRETEILRLVAQGDTVESIAGILNLSPKTVHNYRSQIKSKLAVATDADLVWFAIKHGLIHPEGAV